MFKTVDRHRWSTLFMTALLPLLLAGVFADSWLPRAAGKLPALKAERWVNSAPLTAETLRGRVVLVDFWEYTCVNWIRTSPYIKAWNRDYAPLGLVVIGVHAPELSLARAPRTSTVGFVTMD